MKITTKNFQILDGENTFEFNAGINIIVGPNASGKSSLFYAIEDCLSNPSGVADCINYNATKAEVTIEDNNESVTWIRTADSSQYINNITKESYVKASKLDSRDIADLGFYFDNKGKIMNIHNEWSTLFPFGESDSDMFRLFEDIFNISCSFQIIDEIKKDEQDIKNSITTYQNEKTKIADKIGICNKIKEKVKLEEINDFIETIDLLTDKTSKLRKDYQDYSKSSLLSHVILPKSFDVTTLYDVQVKLDNLKRDFEFYQNNKNKASLEIPKFNISLNIETTKALREIYEQYCVTKANIRDYESQLQKLDDREKELQTEIGKIRICPTCGRIIEE